jgi:spermidine synthase
MPAAPVATAETAGPANHLVLWVFFISGLLSLALEIIWFRMLAVFLRPTAYAFTIMLACVLAGIAIGSAIAAPILRMKRNWLALLTVIQGAIGIAAVLSFNALTRSQQAIDTATPWFERLGLNTYLAPIVASSAIAMLPTTILLGVAFPIGLTLWAGDSPNEDTTRKVGVFYSLNVFGAIIGSVLAGFVLLPQLGSKSSLMVVSALATLSAILLALSMRRSNPSMAVTLAVVSPMLFLMAARLAVDPFDIAFERFHRGETLLWRQEGAQTTVAVHEREGIRRCGSCSSTAITRRTIPRGRHSSTTVLVPERSPARG